MSTDSSNHSSNQGSGFKKLLLPLLVVVLLIAGVVLWNGGKKTVPLYGANNLPPDAVTVFFSKYQGNHSIVENVVRDLPKEMQGEPLQFALTELLKGPTAEEKTQGFYTEIPKGTKLLSLKQSNNTLTINLSRQFTDEGGSTSVIQRVEELKQTVFSVDRTHKINVAVEGKPLEVLGGEGLEVPAALQREKH